jgi:hypothetical protein
MIEKILRGKTVTVNANVRADKLLSPGEGMVINPNGGFYFEPNAEIACNTELYEDLSSTAMHHLSKEFIESGIDTRMIKPLINRELPLVNQISICFSPITSCMKILS